MYYFHLDWIPCITVLDRGVLVGKAIFWLALPDCVYTYL